MELYDELGVAQDATAAEIDSAYRVRAKKLHPDAGGDEEAFVALGNAHAVLKSPERRKRYDEFGDTNVPQDNRAVTVLCSAFAAVLGKNMARLKSTDMVAELHNRLVSDKNELQKKKAEQARANQKIRDAIGRLSSTGPEDHLVVMLKTDLAAAEQQLTAFEESITVHEDAIALAKGYVYRTDEPKEYRKYANLTSSTIYGRLAT